MRKPAEIVIALLDLLEAEALGLRRGVAKGALAAGLMLAAGGLVLGGLALGLWGLHLALEASLDTPAAALLTCLLALLVAAAVAGVGLKVAK